jgi:hypothetical protein
MDKLTPKLTEEQLKQNIDALFKAGKQAKDIQTYVNNYRRDTSGAFVIGSSEPQEPASKTPDFVATVSPLATGGNSGQKALDAASGLLQKLPGNQLGRAVGTSVDSLVGLATGDMQRFESSAQQNKEEMGKTVGDVGKIVSTLGSLVVNPAQSILGKSAQFGATGVLGGASQAASEGGDLKQVVESGAKGAVTGAITGAAFGLAEKGIKTFADLVGKTGDKIQTSVIKPTQADIKDGFSIDTVKKYNLGGSLKQSFEKTDLKLDELSKKLNEKLTNTNSTIDLNLIYEKTAKRLLGNKLENFGSNTQMEGAIEKLRNEISSVSGQNGLVSIPEAQLVKRASGHFGAWTYGVPTPEATASQKVYNTFYNELKTAIEEGSPDGVKAINKEISNLIPVMNALIRRIPVAERNSAISLTDIITLSAASLEPRALALSLANFASKSGRVGALLGKAPKAGDTVKKGIESLEPIVRSQIK